MHLGLINRGTASIPTEVTTPPWTKIWPNVPETVVCSPGWVELKFPKFMALENDGRTGKYSAGGMQIWQRDNNSPKYLEERSGLFCSRVRGQMLATRGHYRRQTLLGNVAWLEFKCGPTFVILGILRKVGHGEISISHVIPESWGPHKCFIQNMLNLYHESDLMRGSGHMFWIRQLAWTEVWETT